MSNIDKDMRFDWTVEEIKEVYCRPLLDLVLSASNMHCKYHDYTQIQKASLLSIKTGGCPENCSYCSQSAHHREVELTKDKLMNPAVVISLAKRAKAAGASRFCMGAAWRQVKDGEEFDAVLKMVQGVRALDMEACVTLGMLKPHQAARLKEAGLTAYNHNLDTSPEYYGDIVTTRTYADRLETLHIVRDADIDICCGGIIGLGETIDDRCSMLKILSNMQPHPESVPINALVAVKGTPLQDEPPIDSLDFVRMIATTRLVMPKSVVRLSAGRSKLSREAQILCFLAGANSLFYGDVLLTTPNMDTCGDQELFKQMAAIA